MNAIAAGWKPEQVRLWTGSALAALLGHLTPAALLIFYIHELPRPRPPAGSPAAMEVELASAPAATAAVASLTPPTPLPLPLPQKPQPELKRPVLQPLAKMEPIAPETAPIPSDAAPANDAGATSPPAAAPSDSTAYMTRQLWVSELKSQLESHKEYPRSAIAALQRDTVNLQISVDRAGHVTSSQIDSGHHYHALEQEVQRMLQLAGPLPTPAQLPAEGVVITVPVQFSLSFRYCKGSHCQTLSSPSGKCA